MCVVCVCTQHLSKEAEEIHESQDSQSSGQDRSTDRAVCGTIFSSSFVSQDEEFGSSAFDQLTEVSARFWQLAYVWLSNIQLARVSSSIASTVLMSTSQYNGYLETAVIALVITEASKLLMCCRTRPAKCSHPCASVGAVCQHVLKLSTLFSKERISETLNVTDSRLKIHGLSPPRLQIDSECGINTCRGRR